MFLMPPPFEPFNHVLITDAEGVPFTQNGVIWRSQKLRLAGRTQAYAVD